MDYCVLSWIESNQTMQHSTKHQEFEYQQHKDLIFTHSSH